MNSIIGRSLVILLWNAVGLWKHINELNFLLHERRIDLVLITEIHFTRHTHIDITGYTVYFTNYPDGSGPGGTAVIVRNGVRHHPYIEPFFTAVEIPLHDLLSPYQ